MNDELFDLLAPFLRVYDLDECGRDGYPLEWHSIGPCNCCRVPRGEHAPECDSWGIKHLIRRATGNRCERCGHPYAPERGLPRRWTACDEQCTHPGPRRISLDGGPWHTLEDHVDPTEFAIKNEVQAEWRILTVHHLTGHWGATGDAKRDCRWWNLAALCQRCHLQIQGKVNMERAFIFEHSEWFKPHAAGWYAVKYLEEDLSRSEALGRLDELLGLERLA